MLPSIHLLKRNRYYYIKWVVQCATKHIFIKGLIQLILLYTPYYVRGVSGHRTMTLYNMYVKNVKSYKMKIRYERIEFI